MFITFYKMHALGNDFVVIDEFLYKAHMQISAAKIKQLANRRTGVGFDQLILIDELIPSQLVKITIYNADGCLVNACGNATRCVALHMMKKYQVDNITIKAGDRNLKVYADNYKDTNIITANMGKASFSREDIPILQIYKGKQINSEHLNFSHVNALLSSGISVFVGNPHVVFLVENLNEVDVYKAGLLIENHPIFPEKTNVEFIEIIDSSTIKMNVWERGAGVTPACGTGAMAAFAVASRMKLIDNSVKTKIILQGGEMALYYDSEYNIITVGGANLVFEGKLEV